MNGTALVVVVVVVVQVLSSGILVVGAGGKTMGSDPGSILDSHYWHFGLILYLLTQEGAGWGTWGQCLPRILPGHVSLSKQGPQQPYSVLLVRAPSHLPVWCSSNLGHMMQI